MLEQTINYFLTLPLWEWLAVITSLLYVVLAARQNIWCWPAALVSTTIYTVIFYDVYLWMDSLLQVYYIGMAIFGWYSWRQKSTTSDQGGNSNTTNTENLSNQLPVQLHIQSWPLITHIKAILILTGISLVIGWLMASLTPADFPYLDALTTVFAVFTTYLVARKILENWLYWIAIDALSIYLYLAKGLQPTAVLFILYTFIAIFGFLQWNKFYQSESNLPKLATS